MFSAAQGPESGTRADLTEYGLGTLPSGIELGRTLTLHQASA